MVKRFIFTFALIMSVSGMSLRAEQNAWYEWKTWKNIPASIKKGLLSQSMAWKKGFQAAKKKLWQKEALNREERQFYKKFLREVGGVAAAATLLTLWGARTIAQRQAYAPSLYTVEEVQSMDGESWKENLFNAARDGDIGTLKALLQASGKDINGADRDGWTALMIACKRGNFDAVQLLLQNGASTDVSDDQMKGFSPLILAADEGHSEIIQLLLSRPYSVPIDTADRWGRTAFMLAAQKGHNDVLQVFLDYKVDIDKQQKEYGTTALMWAVEEGQEETVDLLLKNGADITVRNQQGQTALDIAKQVISEKGRAEREPYEKIIALLEKAQR